ncbi:MAG: hypothetical protein MPW15_17655 [Candidatus Manganitrophus sp.]|nr:hypothetical protein [Candidatus Manganitrophus sp.]
MERITSVPVLASIPDFDEELMITEGKYLSKTAVNEVRKQMAKRVIPDFQEGKGEELVTLTRRASLASDRYRMLFAKVDQLCRTPEKKLIALTSSIKGEGKTTTTANLAVVAARDFGKRCLVIDGDFKNPTLAKKFAMPDESGLIDVIEGKVQLGNGAEKRACREFDHSPDGTPIGQRE